MPKPLQFLLNGSDVTDSVYDAVIEKQEKRGADKCEFLLKRTQAVSVGDDLKVKETAGDSYVFGGIVIEVSKEYKYSRCVALSYGKQLDEVRVFPSRTYISKSPEFIVSDLLTTFTSLTPVTASSGVTINRFEASGLLIENIQTLANIAGFDFWTEISSTGQKQLHFKPANTNLNKTLYLGKVGSTHPNAFRKKHEVDDSLIYNAVEVYGKNRFETVRYRYDRVEGVYTYFPYPRFLSSVGVRYRDNVLVDGVDFEYSPDLRAVTLKYPFPVSETNPAKLEIEALADATPLIYGESSSSISTYGRRGVAVILDNENDVSDLRTFLNKFLAAYSTPRTSLVVEKPGLDFGIKNGGYVTVYDPYLGINGQTFVVRVVRWLYPKGVTEMVLNSFIPELYDFQRNVKFTLEKSYRSSIQLRDVKTVEKKFFFSGTYLTGFTLQEQMNNITAGTSAIYATTASPVYMRIRLQIWGYTATDFNSYFHAVTAITSKPSTPTPFYSQPLPITNEYLSNASNQITLNVNVYASTSLGGTETLIAPTYSTLDFFQVILYNMSKMIPSTLGMVLYVSYNTSGNYYQIHWGPNTPSGIFCLGFVTR
jgi:hypothetical protein